MTVTDHAGNGAAKLKRRWGPERIVDISKISDSSLGLSLVGGRVEVIDIHGNISEDINGVFIKHIDAESHTGAHGYLKVGDHILKINGICVRNSSYDTVIEAIRNAGNSIRLVVQSFTFLEETSTADVEITTSLDLQQVHVANNAALTDIETSLPNIKETNESPEMENSTNGFSIKPHNPLPQSYHREDGLTESSGSEDERYLEGNIRTKAGIEISRKSAGNIKRSSAEIAADPEDEDDFGYTLRKIKKKYDHIGTEVLMAEHVKNGRDIGIALSGHKDRVKMGVFICGISPKRKADSENFRIGDEILEVNGIVFENRCHLNACSMIKKMPSTVLKMVIYRHATTDKSAVGTTNYFPTRTEEKEQYAQFPGVRTITILKGQHGLGIMIIEGKHANVGQGIFASDIQEGSVAEKAGLQVGDMILGVNDDTLVGTTYDEATNLLKAAEGLVLLTVCSPNKNIKDGLNTSSDKIVPPKDTADPPSKTSSVNSHIPESSSNMNELQGTTKLLNEKKAEVKLITTELNISLDTGVPFILCGGCDTLSGGVFINDLYADNIGIIPAPLKCGDQILDFGPENFRHIDHQQVQTVLLTTIGNVKITFSRDDHATEELEVELHKKLGKGFGISVSEFKNGKGVYISDLSTGGSALESEKLAVGDHILSVCGRDVHELTSHEIAILLKVFSPLVFKIARYKTKQTMLAC